MLQFLSAVTVGLALMASTAVALPSLPTSLRPKIPPVPIVIWHGLGDSYEGTGMTALKKDLESRPQLKGVFVWLIKVGEDGASDSKASFFGNANSQVSLVCDQLRALPEITDKSLNPSGKFDAIGFSQGSQLLRAVVERCGGDGGLHVRRLITVGGQHMGINALPPCPPGSSPFSTCRLMHLSIVREGLYSGFAQRSIVPAQYFRDEARIKDYLAINTFLADINNERSGDEEVGPVTLQSTSSSSARRLDDGEPRNATYKDNFSALDKLVLLRFSQDATVVPPQSAHFTLPSPSSSSNCPQPPELPDPSCYPTPVEWSDLPLYQEDYIGLRALDEMGRVVRGVCEGQHMEIDEECWEGIVSWLGDGEGRWEGGKKGGSKLVLQAY